MVEPVCGGGRRTAGGPGLARPVLARVSGLRIGIVTRVRSDRAFYRPAEPTPGKRGRPSRYGERFALKDEHTWGKPDEVWEFQDERYGTVRLKRWKGLSDKRAPDLTCDLIRAETHLEREKPPAAVWFAWLPPVQPPAEITITARIIWTAYVRRWPIDPAAGAPEPGNDASTALSASFLTDWNARSASQTARKIARLAERQAQNAQRTTQRGQEGRFCGASRLKFDGEGLVPTLTLPSGRNGLSKLELERKRRRQTVPSVLRTPPQNPVELGEDGWGSEGVTVHEWGAHGAGSYPDAPVSAVVCIPTTKEAAAGGGRRAWRCILQVGGFFIPERIVNFLQPRLSFTFFYGFQGRFR